MTRNFRAGLFAIAVWAPGHAAPSIPNDCWSGVMEPDNTPHGRLVATGPVAQWRVGMTLVLYATKETFEQIEALAGKGQAGTFDTAQPIPVIPTSISGPDPDDANASDDSITEISMHYRTAHGETGKIGLTYWTSSLNGGPPPPPDQAAAIAELDQASHDLGCRGIP